MIRALQDVIAKKQGFILILNGERRKSVHSKQRKKRTRKESDLDELEEEETLELSDGKPEVTRRSRSRSNKKEDLSYDDNWSDDEENVVKVRPITPSVKPETRTASMEKVKGFKKIRMFFFWPAFLLASFSCSSFLLANFSCSFLFLVLLFF